MTRGRRPEGAGLVRRLAGSNDAKVRLQMIIEVLSGRRTVTQACARLGLSERRFHALRQCALQAALESLEPRPAGRPARTADGEASTEALEGIVRDLRLELRAAQVREEIALTMPELLRRTAGRKKAGRRHDRRANPRGTSSAPSGSGISARTRPPRTGAAPPGSENPATESAASAPAPSPFPAGPSVRG
jgi:hypothetical protein